ncbi:MAG: MFS transporter [Streptosporangiales bacterium]|nr:MFS transporter [Streptosporangiales bacterium]
MRRSIGFFAVCLAYCLIILDGSVLNVAVPAIRHELGTSMAAVQWVLDGYTLPLAGLLLTAGVLGDRFGLRRMLLTGTVVFTVASAACAAAPDSAALIAARAVQGIGAAALLPATLALIPHMFTDAARRARAAVVWVAAGSLSVAAGPLVGGFLIDTFGWRSVFLINLPLGVLSVLLAIKTVPATPKSIVAPLSKTAPVIAAGALGLVAAGLIVGGADGWNSAAAIGLLVGGAILAVLFAQDQRRKERRGASPMIPPSFFRERVRTASVLSAGLMGFTFYGTLLAMSVYFQQARGYSPGGAGLALLPLTAGSAIGPLAAYRPLSRKYGHPVMLLSGFACAALGTAVLGVSGSYPGQFAGLLLVGGASTISFSALTSLLMAHTPTAQSGLASGLQNTTRQSGALFAVSVIGAVLNAADPAGRMTMAFAITGLATAAGLACGTIALRGSRNPARSA